MRIAPSIDADAVVLKVETSGAPQLFGADANQSIARLVRQQCDMIERMLRLVIILVQLAAETVRWWGSHVDRNDQSRPRTWFCVDSSRSISSVVLSRGELLRSRGSRWRFFQDSATGGTRSLWCAPRR